MPDFYSLLVFILKCYFQKETKTPFKQVSKLIDYLLMRTKVEYDKFLYSLVQNGQEHIAQYLTQGKQDSVQLCHINVMIKNFILGQAPVISKPR